MADLVYPNFFVECAKGDIDFDTDTFKVALFKESASTILDPDNTVKANIVADELAQANGYTTGGVASAATVSLDTTNDNAKFDIADVSWDAVTGSIGPFDYAVLYDDTHASDALIYAFDLGGDKTTEAGLTFTITIDSNGLFTVA